MKAPMRQFRRSLAALVLCALTTLAVAQDGGGKGEDVNYVELAGVLIRDGHYDRAADALSQVDTQSGDVNLIRYHTLEGLVLLHQDQAGAAEREFLSAIGAGQEDRVVYVYLAQAQFQQQHYRKALSALEQSQGAGSHIPAVYFMASRAHWELGEHAEALATLDNGRKQFVDETPFLRQRLFYLVKLGLYQEASEVGMKYLTSHEVPADDYVAIGNALRESGQYGQALKFLETARLKFPGNVTVKKLLAHTYLDRGDTLSAAEVMTGAAIRHADLAVEAAELQRRDGNLYRALALNAGVPDQEKKLKQRLAILLALKRYGQAAAMADGLYRVGLLEDEDVRYALAYALFQTGSFDRAETQLASIKRSDLFKKSVELRETIKQCREEPWQCY